MGMELFTEVKVLDAGGCFEDGGESKIVRRDAGGDHVGVCGDGLVEGGGGLGLGAKVTDPFGR